MSIYKYPLCVLLSIRSDFHDLKVSFNQEPATPSDRCVVWDNPFDHNPVVNAPFPQLSLRDIEILIKDGLLPNETIPQANEYPIGEASLLAIYDYMIKNRYIPNFLCGKSPTATPTVLISQIPVKRARAARLIFKGECRFTWNGWAVKYDEPDIEVSRMTVENTSWTRWDKNAIIETIIIDLLKFYDTSQSFSSKAHRYLLPFEV